MAARRRRRRLGTAAFAAVWAGMLLALGLGAAILGAFVLVDAGLDLEQKSNRAVDEAAAQGPPAIQVVEVQAQVRPTGLYAVEVITLGTTDDAAALTNVSFALDVLGTRHIVRHGAVAGPGTYVVHAVRDADGSLSMANPILNRGDLAHLEWELDVDPLLLRPGTTIRQIQLGTATGDLATLTLTIPSAAATGELVRLDVLP